MMNKSTIVGSFEKSWKKLERLLHRNGFKTTMLESERALRRFIYDTIPDNCVVGLSNSLSSSATKIRNILLEKGNKVYYNWNGNTPNRNLDSFDEVPDPDFYLTMADSITEDGTVINNEYSKSAASINKFPRNIIAFSAHENLLKRISYGGLKGNFTIFKNLPGESEITVALLSH